jgi:hypothetical protein
MKIEDLIQLHNQALNRKIEENVYLNQQIKAYLRDRKGSKHPGLWLPFRKSILVYSFLLILFTVLNFILIDGLKKQDNSPRPPQQIILTMNAFSPHYPGSISQAYAEVMK